jgi:uncharacterized protein YndB with AHSA1/START domain
MGTVTQTIVIARPPEAVYDLAWRPERATEWITGMVATSNVRPGDPETGLGCQFDWTYRMLGLTFHGQNRIAEAERPHRLREESRGGLVSTWTWRFDPADGGTLVHITIRYTPPLGWLGRLLDPLLLTRVNQRSMDQTLANLKHLVEEEHAAPPNRTPTEA